MTHLTHSMHLKSVLNHCAYAAMHSGNGQMENCAPMCAAMRYELLLVKKRLRQNVNAVSCACVQNGPDCELLRWWR